MQPAKTQPATVTTPLLVEPRKWEYSGEVQDVLHVTPDDITLGACHVSAHQTCLCLEAEAPDAHSWCSVADSIQLLIHFNTFYMFQAMLSNQ